MASFRFMATNPEEMSPGSPNGRQLLFPFDYGSTSTLPAAFPNPFNLSATQAAYWWWKVRQINLGFGVTATFGSAGFSELSARTDGTNVLSDGDEFLLMEPGLSSSDTYAAPLAGPFTYSWSVFNPDWNGSGGEFSASVTLRMFYKFQSLTSDIDHMLWKTGAEFIDAGVIAPCVHIEGSFTITSPGTEATGNFDSTNGVSPVEVTAPVDFLVGDGGGSTSIGVAATDDVITAVGLEFTVASEFSYTP